MMAQRSGCAVTAHSLRFVCWHLAGIRIRIPFVAGIFREGRLTRHVAFVAAILVGLVTFGASPKILAAQGQNPPPQNISFTVNGSITEAAPGKLTVDSGQNMLFTVTYDSTTQIQHDDGSPAKASDLRVGVKILAKGDLTEAGDVIAKKITIEPGSKGSSQ